MKITDIREINPSELPGELEKMKTRLFEMKSQAATEKLEDSTQMKKIRRDIARIKTVMREREIETAQQS